MRRATVGPEASILLAPLALAIASRTTPANDKPRQTPARTA